MPPGRKDRTEPGTDFDCRLDKKKFKECESPATYKGLDDGAHQFRVRATDYAGNVDTKPATDGFKVKD